MRIQTTKRTKIIIIAVAVVAVLAMGITCGIVFGLRGNNQFTTQEWLTLFGTSLELAQNAKDEVGNVIPVHIVREIEINDNNVVVAIFKQSLQITVDNGQIKALLVIEEEYPTLEMMQDNIRDEYWLIENEMYTRRECGEDVQTANFASNLDVILTVASENLGNIKYDFDEENFLPIENENRIITHDGNIHKIKAMISTDRYKKFFGGGERTEDMRDVKIEMQMTGSLFDWFQIQYQDRNLETTIKITRYDIQPVTKPEWVQ